jgi:PAS domain S-box-containing protein
MSKETKDNILIVDDKVNNIYALEQILSQPGRELIGVTSGNEALKIALNQEIDLIILDVQMPGMDGFEVAQMLKSNKRTRITPIIFVSAELKDGKFVLKDFEEGAIDYLYKPLDPDITEAKVSVLLQLQRQQKELIEKNLALEKYALLINNSADLICIINAKTLQIEDVNNAAQSLLGYGPGDLRSSLLLDYIAEEDREKVKQLSNDVCEMFSFEAGMLARDQQVRCFRWNIVYKNGLWFANGRDITKQQQAEKSIKQLNADLQRSAAQLQLTNKEFESFSYSVSHDLRAPLRSINGYSQIIEEDHIGQMGEEPKRLFTIIRNNAKKMGVLIDDLLQFARMGRKEVARMKVNFNNLTESIIADQKQASKIEVTFKVNDLLPAFGDPVLLSQVFVNLISNAIKYSSKTTAPVVEIGSYEKEDENVYYVKDNGAGFDMTYAHKLFGVFQRLHSNNEFEGTGVGLAIVQRIIVKHGGRVWAEGTVGEGATFYFSLPKNIAV